MSEELHSARDYAWQTAQKSGQPDNHTRSALFGLTFLKCESETTIRFGILGDNNCTNATTGTDERRLCCVMPHGVSDKRCVVGAIPILNVAEDVLRGAFSAISSMVDVKSLF